MKKTSKIISIVFLSFSTLIFLYVLYRSEIKYSGTLSDYYFKYYVVSFVLIVLSVISFFIEKNLKIKISMIFFSIILSFYLIEVYLTMIQPKIMSKDLKYKVKEYEKKTGRKYDLRTARQYYKNFKKKNPNVVMRTFPIHLKYRTDITIIPLSGISKRETILCNENGYYSTYLSDRYGFNNPDNEWDKQEIDFFIVGDSFAQGDCVNEPENIGGNLRKISGEKKGVLNLGLAGNGPLAEYATLREYFFIKKPKRVLFMYYEGNDLEDFSGELRSSILINYLKDEQFFQNLQSKQNIIDQMLLKQEQKMYPNLGRFIKLYSFRAFVVRRLFSNTSNNKSFAIPQEHDRIPFDIPSEFGKTIELSKKFSEVNGASFYFVYLPTYSRYLGNNNKTYLNYSKVIKILENLNIKIIDANVELFEKQNDPLSLFPFKKNGHYNELGYKLIAKTIFKKIREHENIQ